MMLKLKVELKGVKEAIRDLKTFRQKAIPYAVRDALNSMAFETRREWSGEIKRKFTTRNQWTGGRALLVEKARGTDMRRMVAVTGSVAPFMGKQEHGGISRGKSGKQPIPGPVAAGQAAGGKRTRLVRATYKLSRIQVPKGTRFGSRIQRNAIAMAIARRRGQKHVLLDRPRGGKGLFLLGGGKRKLTTRLLWSVGKGSYRVPAHPTLQPALATASPKFKKLTHDAVVKQLRRHKVFGW